jgi:hypothetical protein
MTGLRLGRTVLLVMFAVVWSTDASTAAPYVRSESKVQRPGGELIPRVCPLELTPSMVAWVRRVVPERGPAEVRLRALLNQLLSPQGLHIRQAPGPTTTAAKTFEMRVANCVAFAHLVVALAREGGLRAYFVWTDLEGCTQRDSLRIGERHLAAGYGTASQMMVLDFGGLAQAPAGRFRVVSDVTAAAIFHSNRGVETLLAHAVEVALPWLESAARLDPELDVAWLNLGVGLRRSGDLDGAERAYRRALEINPHLLWARENLAVLMHLRSRLDETVVSVSHVPPGDGPHP